MVELRRIHSVNNFCKSNKSLHLSRNKIEFYTHTHW